MGGHRRRLLPLGVDQPRDHLRPLRFGSSKTTLNRGDKGIARLAKVIFCQGMPFAADALAAAVARQTGSEVIVPPNPRHGGAMGIALLVPAELEVDSPSTASTPSAFCQRRSEQKDTFVCRSNCGCGGAGNRCRIDRLRTVVSDQRSAFTWGGGCSLYDKGTRKRKLPDLAPRPFREREDFCQKLVVLALVRTAASRGKPRVALSDESC